MDRERAPLAGGVYVILATPFTDAGEIDAASLARLVDFSLEAGASGLTPLGILGEFHRLTEAERQRVAEIVVGQAGGRVPVVVGASHGGVAVTAALARHAAEIGAAAVMVAPPNGTRPDPDALVRYYRLVAAESPLPVVVQDEPGFTGVQMPAGALARILTEVEGCVAVKLEDPPTPAKVSQLIRLGGDRLRVYGGLGGVYFLEEMSRGAVGTMTGFAYPEVLVAIHRRLTAGDRAGARDLFYRWLPLIRYEAQAGIGLALRKEILFRRGLIASPAVRAPGVGLDDATRAELAEVLAHVADLQAADRLIGSERR